MAATATNEVVADQIRDVRSATATACPCGQQLDLCDRDHCTRCGRSISYR